MSLQYLIRWYSPIYLNTLNFLKPLKTLWLGRKILEKKPNIKIHIGKIQMGTSAPIYSDYYWDGNFYERNFIFHGLIQDVMWKTKYGMLEFEEPPRWHFIFFRKWYITFSLEFENNYREYERILSFVYKYYD